MEERKIKKTNIKRDFLEIGCAHYGETVLKLMIPRHLGKDFENCFKSDEGMKILNTLQEEYAALSDLHKDTYQMLIFDCAEDIRDVADLVYMMRAMRKCFPEEMA